NAHTTLQSANSSAMPTPQTIRQQLVDKLKLRLARISIANGFQTELGARPIEEWAVAEQHDDLPVVGVYDLDNESTQDFPQEKGIGNSLPFQVRFFIKREETPALARQYL